MGVRDIVGCVFRGGVCVHVQVENILSRVHALVLGPGMGRHPVVLELAAQVLRAHTWCITAHTVQ